MVLTDGLVDGFIVFVFFRQSLQILSKQQLIFGRSLDRFDDIRLEVKFEFFLDSDGFRNSFEVLDDLLPLHEVVAVLAINHEELVVGFEIFADEGGVRVPAKHGRLHAQQQILAQLNHGLYVGKQNSLLLRIDQFSLFERFLYAPLDSFQILNVSFLSANPFFQDVYPLPRVFHLLRPLLHRTAGLHHQLQPFNCFPPFAQAELRSDILAFHMIDYKEIAI